MAPVETAVAVGVFQQPDHADRLALLPGAEGVVEHLDDIHPTVLVVGEGDRVVDQRFPGDQVDDEVVEDPDGREGLGGFLGEYPPDRTLRRGWGIARTRSRRGLPG